MTIVLEARDLHYRYGPDICALNGLSLTLRRGRRLAILGANGAGKTTLLLHLNGTLRPQSGMVLLDGEAAQYSRAGLLAWRRKAGLVLQEADDQLFAATVAGDVSFGPLNLGLSGDDVRRRTDDALNALGIAALADRPTHMLSFGQKKRVAIAGALAMHPEILLLDEPTAGLDCQGSEQLLAVLAGLEARGTTLLFTTHDVDFAGHFADEIALFRDGRILAQGEPAEIFSNKTMMAAAGLIPPLVFALGEKARSLGLTDAASPLPRTRRDLEIMLEQIAAGRGQMAHRC